MPKMMGTFHGITYWVWIGRDLEDHLVPTPYHWVFTTHSSLVTNPAEEALNFAH